jgi:ferredoxin
MCEWCTKHGAGKKWYMNARYYAAEVARELDTEEFLMEQVKNFQKTFLHYDAKLTHMLRMPLFGRLIGRYLERQSDSKRMLDIYKEAGVHGQTIPLEDGITILQELAGDPILYDYCYCRWSHRGIKKRCCFEFGIYSEIVDRFSRYAPEKVRIDPEKAVEELKKHNKEGLVATIYCVPAPHISSLCACERPECFPYRVRLDYKERKAVYKAEYIAVTDPDTCVQVCTSCVSMCSFGAIKYVPLLNRVMIDSEKCFGCGVCRHACDHDAISLQPRENLTVSDEERMPPWI